MSLLPGWSFSQAEAPHQHNHAHGQAEPAPASPHPAQSVDARTSVKYPKAMREHTLTSMRDHLLALSEISAALSLGDYDKAAKIAEWRLGLSAMQAHGAGDSVKYMPKGMQDIGYSLHQSASQFAVAAQDASASNDLPKALKAFTKMSQSCVACHAAYRLD